MSATSDMVDPFLENAKHFAKNPLGIIALFIVMIYAVGSIVIVSAKPEFYANYFHPAILFLSLFPALVLIVFALLVALVPSHLYGPHDFANQDNFFRGIRIPVAILRGRTDAATSDTQSKPLEQDLIDTAEGEFKSFIDYGVVLIHEAKLIKGKLGETAGEYGVRVWIESIEGARPLLEIESVTYHLWPDFESVIQTTMNRESAFDIWLSIWGEFPIVAVIRDKQGKLFTLHRLLNLPKRVRGAAPFEASRQ
jgi:hypothetical protein